MANNPVSITYIGHGQSGVWSDPRNWTNGVVPGAANTALFTSSAVLNGPIEVDNLMLLGAETITINGQVKTDSANSCQSFMACEGAEVTFTAGSQLLDAGGFITGIDAAANVVADGAVGGIAAAVLNVADMKLGQMDGGSGTLTLAGGILNDGGIALVGLQGAGILNVSGAGQANLGGLTIGAEAGGTGQLNLTGSAVVNIAGWTAVGTAIGGAPGGDGAASVGTGSTLYCDHGFFVNDASAIAMQGGTLLAGPDGIGLQIRQGGTVSGHGAITAAAKGVTDNGLLAAAGGTLVVTGNLSGMGAVQIGAGSTLHLITSKITVPTLAFMGPAATLELATGVVGNFTISGFAASDQLVMNNIDSASWSGATHVLTLSEHGQALERLTLSGVAANAEFMVSAGTGGSIISLVSSTGHEMLNAAHFGH